MAMEDQNKTIAILAGGFSSEFEISIASGRTAERAFQEAGYATLWITLTKDGFKDEQGKSVEWSQASIDYVFNAIHGNPGENGLISGVLELYGIPHSTCATFESALTFDKGRCNALLRSFGVVVPKGQLFMEFPGEDFFINWEFPLFVKPNRSGSSFGVSKVKHPRELRAAFEHALTEDHLVLVEEGVAGIEVGCGVFSSHWDFEKGNAATANVVQPIEVTEIVPTQAEFFDFEAKYNGMSQEITPARLSEDVLNSIKKSTSNIYTLLDLKGIVRMDFIVSPEGQATLIEINSIPGLSPASIIPQQIKSRGWSLSDVLSRLAEEAMNRNNRSSKTH